MPIAHLAAATAAAVLAGAAPVSTPAPIRATTLNALIVIELDICYTTMMARYYKPVTGAQLLGGARTGMIAYLKSRGIDDPQLPIVSPTIDRWRAEDALTHYLADAIQRYGDRADVDGLVQASCAGQLASVNDPYTILFHPQEFKGFNAFLDGAHYGGIGVVFARLAPGATSFDAGAVVEDVFPGGPAAKAGVLPGDVVLSVDGTAVAALTPQQVQDHIRGKTGTRCTLAIKRGDKTLSIDLTREAIVPPDAIFRMLPGDVGYVQLRAFGADSGKQVSRALDALAKRGARAYILDLRNNGGGYRDDAIDVASHFVSGRVVTVQERNGAPTVFAAKDVPRINGPLAVLVDKNTASGSEIVAGAVQDDRAGTIVGERTFGKGLVQEVYPLPDKAALKITTARYFTPAGRDINGKGIEPDVEVVQPKDAVFGVPGRDAQLDRALTIVQAAR